MILKKLTIFTNKIQQNNKMKKIMILEMLKKINNIK